MSESDGEQAARSLALEQAYVHEVYEQCADRTVQGKHWPRIYQFLEELEPGALVCDIGESLHLCLILFLLFLLLCFYFGGICVRIDVYDNIVCLTFGIRK